MKSAKLFKTIWPYIKKDKVKFIIFVVLIFFLSFQSLIYPYLLSKALKSLLEIDLQTFTFYLVMWSGIALTFRLLVALPHDLLYNILELNLMKKISKALYAKVLNLPAVAFEEHGVGEFINRVYNDPDKIIDLLSRLIRFIAKLITAIFILIFVINTSWILAVEVIFFTIIVYLLSTYFNPKIKETQEKIKETSDTFTKESTQNLIGIREVKVLGIKSIINKYIFKNIDGLVHEQKRSKKFQISYNHIIWLFFLIMEFAILYTSGYLFIKGQLAFEVFVMLEFYLYQIYDAATSFSDFGINYNQIIVSLRRLSEILDNKLYKDEKFGKVILDNIQGNIKFENVCFGYQNEAPILNNLDLEIPTNKKIAIIGKSGMGKTTIFNLLARFFDKNSGKILIDGIDIEELTEDTLRNNIAVIRQDPYIFNRTFKGNFELVREDITMEEIEAYCKKAYIHDYIMSLPKQYDTLIGENGVNLSGGQKQRLAIARSLAKNTKIILFDEATSALDNESQTYIKNSIDELVKNHTIIIIAHRLSTIMDADEIIVIDKGKAVIKGKHEELMIDSLLYKNLYTNEII